MDVTESSGSLSAPYQTLLLHLLGASVACIPGVHARICAVTRSLQSILAENRLCQAWFLLTITQFQLQHDFMLFTSTAHFIAQPSPAEMLSFSKF